MSEDDIGSLVEQLRDIWTGRDTYDSEKEWLDNVEFQIRELCAATGQETASFFKEDE